VGEERKTLLASIHKTRPHPYSQFFASALYLVQTTMDYDARHDKLITLLIVVTTPTLISHLQMRPVDKGDTFGSQGNSTIVFQTRSEL